MSSFPIYNKISVKGKVMFGTPGLAAPTSWSTNTDSSLTGITKFYLGYGNSVWILSNASDTLYKSTDNGITWSSIYTFSSSNGMSSVKYVGGTFIAYSYNTSTSLPVCSKSTDGSSWSSVSLPISTTTSRMYDSAYGASTHVSVGSSLNQQVLYSTDGVTTWTAVNGGYGSSGTFGSPNTVAYGAGLFVSGSTKGAMFTSPDGITWTQRTSSFGTISITNAIGKIRYDGSSLFVAIGGSSGAPKVATSSDGINWTQGTPGWTGIATALDYGNGYWTVCTSTGEIFTSPDGTTWTSQTSGTSSAIIDVAYGNHKWIAGVNSILIEAST